MNGGAFAPRLPISHALLLLGLLRGLLFRLEARLLLTRIQFVPALLKLPQSLGSRLAFAFLLRTAHATRQTLHAGEHRRHEGAVMRRTLRLDKLVRGRDALGLQLLLQRRLRILGSHRKVMGHTRKKRARDEVARHIEAAVDVQRRDNGLVHVLKRRMHAALAGSHFGIAKDDDIGKSELACHFGKRRSRDQRHLDARQAALVEVLELLESRHRDDDAQDAVAQELEALIGILNRFALRRRRVRDGGKDRLLVLEGVAQNLLNTLDAFELFNTLHAPTPPRKPPAPQLQTQR